MAVSFIDHLHSKGVALVENVADALRSIDRADFMVEGDPDADFAFPIGEGQTISQPFTVAFMLDRLDVREGMRVLDVGSGSGWTSALLAHMVGGSGSVIGVEVRDALVTLGKKNLAKYPFAHARIVKASGMGCVEYAPYDRILVSASAKGAIPDALLDQLAQGGVLVGVVDDAIVRMSRDGTVDRWRGFSFVPLMDLYGD